MTAAEVSLEVPLRECTSWCEVGGGHGDEHPDDRACWSTYQIVPLSRHQALRMGDGKFWQAFLNVYLRRRVGEDEPVIYVHSEEADKEIVLTLAEAAELRDFIDYLLQQAGGTSGPT
jgi:hypothetical protein